MELGVGVIYEPERKGILKEFMQVEKVGSQFFKMENWKEIWPPPLTFRIISPISYFRKWDSLLDQATKWVWKLSFCNLTDLVRNERISLLDFVYEPADPHALIFENVNQRF